MYMYILFHVDSIFAMKDIPFPLQNTKEEKEKKTHKDISKIIRYMCATAVWSYTASVSISVVPNVEEIFED